MVDCNSAAAAKLVHTWEGRTAAVEGTRRIISGLSRPGSIQNRVRLRTVDAQRLVGLGVLSKDTAERCCKPQQPPNF